MYCADCNREVCNYCRQCGKSLLKTPGVQYLEDPQNVSAAHQTMKSKTVQLALQKQTVTHFNNKHGLTTAIYFLVILGLPLVVNSAFLDVPKNAVVMKSTSAEAVVLACKSDCGCKLHWVVRSNRGGENEKFYNGYFLREDAASYCSVIEDEPGECYLRTNPANSTKAAQTYVCVEPGTLAEASADVILLDNLLCNDSSTEDLVNLTCSIEFRGNWAPTMEWKEQMSDGEIILSMGVNTIIFPNERVTSSLVMGVQRGRRNFACTTKFDISEKPVGTTAINVPEYNGTWISSIFPKSQASNSIGLSVGLGVGLGVPIVIGLIILAVVLSRRTYSGEPSSPRDEHCMKNL